MNGLERLEASLSLLGPVSQFETRAALRPSPGRTGTKVQRWT